MGETKRERSQDEGRGRSGSPPIYRTSAPLGTETVMTPRPSGTPLVVLRGSLVTFVPCCPSRCSCSESRRPLFHREIVPSAFFFHGFFLLPPRSPTAGFDTNSAPDLLPLFLQCARAPLFFQIHVSLALSRSASLRLFLHPLPALPLPHPSFPRPRTLRPVVVFFWSLFPRVELVFLPARRQVRGCSRMGRMEGRGTRMRG